MPDNKLAGLNQAEKDATAPATGDVPEKPADLVVSRSADADAKPVVDAPAPVAAVSDPVAGTPTVLNATPGADPGKAPDLESQRTGPAPAPLERAPSMTRGAAINQLEVRWGELVNLLHDFDHDTSGLPDDLVALVDFVKSRANAKA